MPALLIVNPRATTLTRSVRDAVIARLYAGLDALTVTETRHRGHAGELARKAVTDGLDAVITLGGDGTLNEAVNGLLSDGVPADPDCLPAVVPLPAGSANVFARSVGVPRDLRRAADLVVAALHAGRRRPVTLGRAGKRYFTFCAGLGFDAEVVREVEAQRAAGLPATTGRYVRTALRRFFATDRRHPALTVETPGGASVEKVLLGIVSNTAPWTYAGPVPVNPTPGARLAGGLDALAVRRMDMLTTARLVAAMATPGGIRPGTPGTATLHDLPAMTFHADRPVAFQVDGEYLGEVTRVSFASISDAIRLAL